MATRLKVKLFPNWRDCSHENPDGPPTYMRSNSVTPGPLQISWAWYKRGKLPNPTDNQLISLSQGTFAKVEGIRPLSSASGDCAVGRFGTAISTSPNYPRLQSWHLSNGRDFVMVTHICSVEPDPKEVAEAARIVSLLTIKDRE